MRVLFDQATPVPLRTFLIGHLVRTAAQQHWDTLENGELLTVAERAGFEVFLTTRPASSPFPSDRSSLVASCRVIRTTGGRPETNPVRMSVLPL